MTSRICALALVAGLLALRSRAQTAPAEPAPVPTSAAEPTAPAPTPVPVSVPTAAPPAEAPATAPILPIPPPVLRLVDPPVIIVETLPTENPFAMPFEAPAMAPVKPVAADGVVTASLFAAIRVDPKGKAVSVRRARDPIPSLAAPTLASLTRWTFDPPGRKAGQPVDSWALLRLDLSVEIDSPKFERVLLLPVTPTTPLPQPTEWGADAAWLEAAKPAAPVEGTIPNEQLDTPPAPKKQPWSSSSYKGPFAVKFWVKINESGRVDKSLPVSASDPVLVEYFRKAIASWLFRPARAGNAAVATWNELSLSGQIAYSTDLKLTTSLRQPF